MHDDLASLRVHRTNHYSVRDLFVLEIILSVVPFPSNDAYFLSIIGPCCLVYSLLRMYKYPVLYHLTCKIDSVCVC